MRRVQSHCQTENSLGFNKPSLCVTEKWHGPRAERPMVFYKDAANTKKGIDELCPNALTIEVKPAEVNTELAMRELEPG